MSFYELCTRRTDIRNAEDAINTYDRESTVEYFGFSYDDDDYIIDDDGTHRNILFVILQDYDHTEVDEDDERLNIIDGSFEDTYHGEDILVYVTNGYITKALFPSGYKYLYKKQRQVSSWYHWEPSVESYLEATLNPDTDNFIWK